MHSTRLLFPIAIATLCGGCGARFRHEVIGTARTGAAAGGPAAAVTIHHPHDRHDVEVYFALPRAVQVAYELSCPGETFQGVIGESWQEYRERRLRELRAERDRQVNAVGTLVGAAVGHAGAGAKVSTPNAEAHVEAEVDGEAAGRAIADGAIADVQLPPGDVGAQHHLRTFPVQPVAAGSCTIALSPAADAEPIDGVTADMKVTRLVNLARERAIANARANQSAIELRGRITAGLVSSGADPDKRRREREAQALADQERLRARHEAELRVQAERRAEQERRRRQRHELELRLRAEQEQRRRARYEVELRLRAEQEQREQAALLVRGSIVTYLIASGCDPDKRRREREARARAEAERLEREREAARLAYEARLRAEQEARLRAERVHRGAYDLRGRIVALLIAGGADPDYRRKRHEAELRAFELRAARDREERLALEASIRANTEGALHIRAGIKLSLIEAGAIDRPPRPAPLIETPPPPPVPGAVWVSGSYGWSGIGWEWQPGYWSDPPARGAVWVAPVEIVIDGAAVLRPGGWHDKKTGKQVRTRDHRKPRRP